MFFSSERKTANKEPMQEFKSTAVLPYIRVHQRFFTAAYNIKAYELFLSRTQHLGLT